MEIAQSIVERGGYRQVIHCLRGYVAVSYSNRRPNSWDVRAQYGGGGHTVETATSLEEVSALESEYIERLGGIIEQA